MPNYTADDYFRSFTSPTPNKFGGNSLPENIIRKIEEIERETGNRMTDAEKQQLVQDMNSGATFDITATAGSGDQFANDGIDPFQEARAPRTAAPVLPEKAASPEEEGLIHRLAYGSRDFTSAAIDAAQGTAEQYLGEASHYGWNELPSDLNRILFPVGDNKIIPEDLADTEIGKKYGNLSEVLLARAAENQKVVQDYRDREGLGQGWSGGARGLGLAVAENPDMALTSAASMVPIVGTELAAALATVPASRVFVNDYYQQTQAGVPKDEAKAHALAQAAIEMGAEITPGGKFIKGGKVLTSTGWKVAKKAGEEFIQEAGTEAAQGGLDTLLGQSDIGSKELRESAKKSGFQSGADFADRVSFAGAVGSVAAGAATAYPAHLQTVAEEANRLHELATKSGRVSMEEILGVQSEKDKAATDRAMDIMDEAENVAKEQEKDRAFTERAAPISTEQKSAEEEAAFRTIERQRVADQIATNPAVKVAPIKPVTPEEVQAERQSQKDAEDARLERVDTGQRLERIRARQELARKADEAEAAAKADSERKAAIALKAQKTKHENKVIDEVYAANKGMTAEQLDPLVQDALAKNPFVPTTKAPEKAAVEPKAASAPTKPAAPKAAPAPVQEAGKPAEKPAPATPGTQSEIDSLSAQLGLEPRKAPETLAMKRAKKAEPQLDPDSFAGKHLRVLKALVKRKTQLSTDVQELAMQGKMVFAPNPESVGRDPSDDAAEYDTGSGKMYVYTDNMENPDDVAGMLVRAVHESGHDNQFSDAKGKSTVMQALMDTKATSKAAKVIREAAASGNELAKNAVAAAEKAGEVEDFELIPYFVGEVVNKREGTSLGRLGGVARDIRQAGRDFLRDKLGMDLDLSMNDIHTAAMKLPGEAVRANRKGKDSGPSLSMIGGKGGKNFKPEYKGITDDKDRYEFSDRNSSINDGSDEFQELRRGQVVDLTDILNHPKLLEEYPQAQALTVKADSELYSAGVDGQYTGGDGAADILINPQLLAPGRRDELLSVLLHEIQHYIQDVEGFTPGANQSSFKSQSAKREVDDARDDLAKVIDNFELQRGIDTLPPQARELYEKSPKTYTMVNGLRKGGRDVIVQRFLEDGWAGRSTDSSIRRYIDRYDKAISRLANAREEFRKSDARALDAYLRDEGEVEARNTQARRLMTDEDRKAQPPLSTYKSLAGVDPKNVLDSAKYIGRPSMIPAALAMRNPEKVTGTKEFKNWFKDSKVVNPDGSPKIMYHGTRAIDDFDVWRSNPARDLGMHFGTAGQANHNRFVDSDSESNAMKDQHGFRILPSRIIPVYLSIQNPLRMQDVFGSMGMNSLDALKDTGVVPKATLDELKSLLPYTERTENHVTVHYGDRVKYVQAFEEAIKKAGYDGIVYQNTQEPSYVEYGVDEDGNEDPYKILDVQYDDSYIVFDPTQIKSAVANNGQFDPRNPSILKMANPKGGPELPFTRKIPPVVSAFLSSSAGAGKVAREIIEHAVASPAGERMIAEGTIGDYRDGVRRLAKQRGVSEEAINKEISEKLDAIDKRENDYDKNLEAFKQVASQYGKAGDALIKFRNQADNLTFQMIRERVAQGTPLTAKEVETYTTMRNNLGRYAHRQFAIHMGKGGKKWAKEVYKDYEKFQKANGNVSQKVKDNYQKVADAVKLIVDEHLVIPSDAELMEMSTTDVKRLFDVWGGKTNPEAYSLSQQRSILSDKRDTMDPDVMKATAENIVQDIIGIVAPKSPLAKSFRGGKIDQSILKERAWITPEIRKVMGEITDPAMRLFSTVAKQTEFIARSQMLMELRDNVGPEHLQPPGPSGRPEVKGMELLKGEEYGPLQNHYVSKNLANLLSSHVQQLATFEQAVAMAITRPSALGTLASSSAVQAWGNVAGKAKMLQIVGKPINFLINFMGGPRSMLINGNLNPLHLMKAMNTAGHIIAYSIDPSKSNAEARRVTTVGITDSAFVGEINSEVYHELNKLLKEMKGKPPSKIMDAINKWAILAPKEAYAMMDVVYKIANFYQQADAILPAYYKAEGVDKTQKQIDREAADIVNGTNVTYKRAAPIVKNLERYGITQFGTFFYEVFRSEVNNVKQGFKELDRAKNSKTAKGKTLMAMTGARRISGQLTAWYLTGMAARMLAALAFGDDDDREDKLRAMLPDYLQNQDFVKFGQDEEGKDVLFDWSRVDPAGPMTDLMRTALNQDGDYERLKKDIFDLYVAPRLGTRLVEAGLATGGRSKKIQEPLVQEKFPDQFESILNMTHKAGLSDNATKAWALVGETFLPGIVSGWGKSNARPVMEDGPSTIAALATYGGARMYTLDNQRAVNSASFDHNDVLKDNRAEISQYFDNHPNATLEQVTDTLAEKRDEEKATFDRLQEVYDGMRELGHSHKEIADILKKNHISADTVNDLKKGTFHFRSLSQKSIEGFRRNEIVGKTLQQKREINEKWKNAAKLLSVAEDQLEEGN